MVATVEQPDLANLEPGIYPGMSFADYRKIKAVNASVLLWARQTMRHLFAALEGKLEQEDTDALGFGRALHTKLLEPDEFDRRYLIAQQCAAILMTGPNRGKQCQHEGRGMRDGNWFCGSHADGAGIPEGAEVLSKSELAQINAAADALKKHPAESLRKCRGEFEVVVVGDLMGVRCKARIDKLIRSPLTIVDPKKVAAASSPHTKFSGSELNFTGLLGSLGYGLKAAFQCDLIQAVLGQQPRFFWIAVEDNYPYCAGAYQASNVALAAGRNEYRTYLSQLKAAQDSGEWPGYTTDVVMIDGPNWWLQQWKGLD